TDGWIAALRSPDRLGQMPLALAMSLERSPAFRAQAGTVPSPPRDRTEAGGGAQARAAPGAVRPGRQHQVPDHQVHPRLVAGEQVQLFVRLDRLIGMQGPGAARHGRLRKGGATLAERREAGKPQSSGLNTGQKLSSKRLCALAAGWIPSACIMPSTPPTPSRKKGTQGSRYSCARSANTCSKARL